MVPPESCPPGLSIATMHSPPAIYEGLGLGFWYKWLTGLVSRVCTAGLDSRVWYLEGLVSRVCPGGTKYGTVDSPGGPQFWGDR